MYILMIVITFYLSAVEKDVRPKTICIHAHTHVSRNNYENAMEDIIFCVIPNKIFLGFHNKTLLLVLIWSLWNIMSSWDASGRQTNIRSCGKMSSKPTTKRRYETLDSPFTGFMSTCILWAKVLTSSDDDVVTTATGMADVVTVLAATTSRHQIVRISVRKKTRRDVPRGLKK